MTMQAFKISNGMLRRAVQQVLKEESAGMLDLEIVGLSGVVVTGEAFEIDSLEVMLMPKVRTKSTSAADKSGRYTPPTGRGKIRLAAVDGEVL